MSKEAVVAAKEELQKFGIYRPWKELSKPVTSGCFGREKHICQVRLPRVFPPTPGSCPEGVSHADHSI